MLHALALSRRVESGELAPLDLVDICGKAIAQHEGAVGAFAALDLEAARRRAGDDAEKLRASPLRGLPVGFKDIFDSADFPTGYGSSIYAGYRPRADAALVAMALRAGANILGKTVTTELAHLKPSRTRNPHNLAYSPGGSSSGSAAAIAAGMLPVAFGSQTGGSVVRPAAYCGVVGFKPSYKLLPMAGAKCFSWHLDTAGLFAASVPDVAFAAAAVSGRDLRVDAPPKGAPRIGLVRTHIWTQASPAMRSAVETAAKRADAAGASVREITLPPILDDAWRIHPIVQDYEAVRALAFEYDRHRDEIGPLLRQLLDEGLAITADVYDEARRTTRRARQALAEVMADVDVLLTPSAPGAAPDPSSTGQAIFNRLWTLMGTPCVNVPGLADENRLPLGVQVVGRFGRDRRALEVAAFIEAAIAS